MTVLTAATVWDIPRCCECDWTPLPAGRWRRERISSHCRLHPLPVTDEMQIWQQRRDAAQARALAAQRDLAAAAAGLDRHRTRAATA